MKLSRKTQTAANSFVYILAAIVIGVTLIVGTGAFFMVRNNISEFELQEAQSKMVNGIEKNSKQFGSKKKLELVVPGKFTTVCFVSSLDESTRTFDSNVKTAPMLSKYPVIEASVIADNEDNIFFLTPDEDIGHSFQVANLDVDGSFLCVDQKEDGTSFVFLEGKGNKVRLTNQLE